MYVTQSAGATWVHDAKKVMPATRHPNCEAEERAGVETQELVWREESIVQPPAFSAAEMPNSNTLVRGVGLSESLGSFASFLRWRLRATLSSSCCGPEAAGSQRWRANMVSLKASRSGLASFGGVLEASTCTGWQAAAERCGVRWAWVLHATPGDVA